jgi:hypothetical protein
MQHDSLASMTEHSGTGQRAGGLPDSAARSRRVAERRRRAFGLAFAAAAIALYVIPPADFADTAGYPAFRASAEASNEASIGYATAAYLVTKGAAKALSVISNTEFSANIPFVGSVAIAPGRLLDAAIAAMDRFGDFLFLCIVYLGVLRYLLFVTDLVPLAAAAWLALAGITAALFPAALPRRVARFLLFAACLVAMVKLVIPVALVATAHLSDAVLVPALDQAMARLAEAAAISDTTAAAFALPAGEEEGMFDKITALVDSIGQYFSVGRLLAVFDGIDDVLFAVASILAVRAIVLPLGIMLLFNLVVWRFFGALLPRDRGDLDRLLRTLARAEAGRPAARS